jgi:hypothetical protein
MLMFRYGHCFACRQRTHHIILYVDNIIHEILCALGDSTEDMMLRIADNAHM